MTPFYKIALFISLLYCKIALFISLFYCKIAVFVYPFYHKIAVFVNTIYATLILEVSYRQELLLRRICFIQSKGSVINNPACNAGFRLSTNSACVSDEMQAFY